MKTLDSLQQVVAHVPQASIHEATPGYPFIHIANAFASASIALHGAHLTSFIPSETSEVIFLSREAVFKPGTPIRGGIPICWPWFSRHQQQADLPSHGIARTSFWNLQKVLHIDNQTHVVMTLSTDGNDPRWPFIATASICFTIGASLSIALTTHNADRVHFSYGDALHSYFRVTEAKHCEVFGLDGCTYVFRLEDDEPKIQTEPIVINRPIDRIFQASRSCSVIDRANGRTIVLEKSGSENTVVWNPGAVTAKDIGDLADEEHSQFVCIEPANAYPSSITLEPGASHTTEMSISLEQFPV